MSNKKKITNPDEINSLISLKRKDLTKDKIIELFASTMKHPEPKYNTYDEITIPKGKWHNNKEPIDTTVGSLIINIFFFNDKLYDIVGYVNDTIDAKFEGKIESILDKATMDDKITVQDYIQYLDDIQGFGFAYSDFMCTSMSPKTTKRLPEVEKYVEAKYKELGDKLNDPTQAAKLENEALAIAKSIIGDDPGMDIYNSGANASFGNNYKNMFVTKGPIRDTATGKYNFVKGCYSNGMDKEDLPSHFDSLVLGAYAKGVSTRDGGYKSKKFFAAFQSLVLDKKGSDCGSKKTLEITLTPDIMNLFLYRYVVEGNKLIMLDSDTIEKYKNKTVKLRSPLYCCSDKICNKCAGELYYKLGIENLGLTSAKISNTLLNKSMKTFHDTSIKIFKMSDPDMFIS